MVTQSTLRAREEKYIFSKMIFNAVSWSKQKPPTNLIIEYTPYVRIFVWKPILYKYYRMDFASQIYKCTKAAHRGVKVS